MKISFYTKKITSKAVDFIRKWPKMARIKKRPKFFIWNTFSSEFPMICELSFFIQK